MPFALVIIGLVMVVTGAKGTQSQLGAELRKDFTGDGNFLYWFAVIAALGALGTIDSFKNFARSFIALVLVAMILANGGVFQKLIEAIQQGPISPATPSQEASKDKSLLQKAAGMLVNEQDYSNNIFGTDWVGALGEYAKNAGNATSERVRTNMGRAAKLLGFFF